jgi:hypothetical protein
MSHSDICLPLTQLGGIIYKKYKGFEAIFLFWGLIKCVREIKVSYVLM